MMGQFHEQYDLQHDSWASEQNCKYVCYFYITNEYQENINYNYHNLELPRVILYSGVINNKIIEHHMKDYTLGG